MLRNYFVTAYRNIKKNLTHTLLNVIGLGIGIACVLTVFSIIDFEYSFDNWHSNKDNIYRVTTKYYGDYWTSHDGIIPYATGEVLKKEFPEVKSVVEFHGPRNEVLSFTDNEGRFQIYRESDVLMSGSSYLKEMDFNVLEGNAEDLDLPNKIFLTERVAKKYFPEGNVMGKTIKFKNEVNLEVAGILENHPGNTNLPFNVIISIESLKENQKEIWNLWDMTWAYTAYVVLENNVNINHLSRKIDETFDRYANPDKKEEWSKTEVILQPLDEIHTDEKYGDGYNYVTPSLIIYTFIFLSVLVMGTAILNFINLNTAIAVRRSKEIGVRKTLGGSRMQLIFQFMMETLFVVFFSVSIGFMLSQILMDFIQKELFSISYELTYTINVVIFSIAFGFLITFLAGFYPAMVLAAYKPVDAIKNSTTLKKGSGSLNVRRGLIVTQFVLTSILIISALIVSAQMDFAKNRDMGFDYEDVVVVSTPSESEKDPEGFMKLIQSKSYVQDACLQFEAPLSDNNWNNSYSILGEDIKDGHNANLKFIDENYIDFYNIKILAGRNITDKNSNPNDSTYNVLVNEHLISTLGWKTPNEAIGRTIQRNRDLMKIVGVVDNFSVNNAKRDMRPVILHREKYQLKQVALSVPIDHLQEYRKDIEATFREYYPNELFEFAVLKSRMDGYYIVENLLMKVIQFISFVSVLLSAMGLYGLVSYMANRNAKVIGIRKVFGATTRNILGIFTKEYMRLIVIAFFLAGPVVYFLVQIWIEEFVYRIEIGPKYFLLGFGITLFISILTVGYRSFLAARANPVESLRYE